MGRFLLHSGSFHLAHKGKASAIRSTGCHGGTRREVSQIDRGIAVPVMDRTARLARPLPIRQRQASMYVLTIGTHTTGRKPTIRYGNAGGVHGCFVVQLSPELESADISNGKGQAVVCHHAAHIQVFDTDDAELTNNLCRCLVQRVLPDRRCAHAGEQVALPTSGGSPIPSPCGYGHGYACAVSSGASAVPWGLR